MFIGGSAHPIKRYVSWVQNDVNQFGLYLKQVSVGFSWLGSVAIDSDICIVRKDPLRIVLVGHELYSSITVCR